MPKSKSKNKLRREKTPQPISNQRLSLLSSSKVLRFLWDVAAVLSFTAALLTLLGLLNWGGIILNIWAAFLRKWFGWGSLLFVISLGLFGWKLLQRPADPKRLKQPFQLKWGQILVLEVTFFAFLAALSLFGGSSIQRAEAGMDGGMLGWGLAQALLSFLSAPFAILIILILAFLLLYSAFGLPQAWLQWIEKEIASKELPSNFLQEEEPPIPIKKPSTKKQPSKPPPQPVAAPEPLVSFAEEEEEQLSLPLMRNEGLPPLSLLEEDVRSAQPNDKHIQHTAELIEQTLADFGITAKVIGYQIGPTITQYALDPGYVEKVGNNGEVTKQKVRVAQINALSKDLALALSATRLRIEAPVPGRPYVGIEVPNAQTTQVRLRSLLQSERFQQINSPLALALGRDVAGKVVAADLAKMPHLLIAGTTGSGKSVCISAIAVCLMMNASPDDLRLVMIDPKMVELVHFNNMPHLLGKVETETKRIQRVLQWLTAEMERRYQLLEASRSRHIQSHNRKVQKSSKGEKLPSIVVLIDELADLMMAAPEQTEYSLVRLAQLARATGIHLVVATQRPSTDIVTGLIKANFPARLSFAVASSIDSRVILDTPGAEALLGKGDMLFLPPEASAPIRAQGVMVSDDEIQRVISFWHKQLPPETRTSSPWDSLVLEQEQTPADQLLEQAIEIVRKAQRANASLLQRRLRIGYPRAARLLDELEEKGIIGPADQALRGDREVYLPPEDDAAAE